MSKKEHKLTPAELAAWYEMTPEESLAWCESGLSACEDDLDNLVEEAIIRYGRLLEKKKHEQLEEAKKRVETLTVALKRIAGCDWTTIEMDLRNIARDALE